jgi:hypothetical protein
VRVGIIDRPAFGQGGGAPVLIGGNPGDGAESSRGLEAAGFERGGPLHRILGPQTRCAGPSHRLGSPGRGSLQKGIAWDQVAAEVTEDDSTALKEYSWIIMAAESNRGSAGCVGPREGRWDGPGLLSGSTAACQAVGGKSDARRPAQSMRSARLCLRELLVSFSPVTSVWYAIRGS